MKFLEDYYEIVEINRKDLGVVPKPDFNEPAEHVKAEAPAAEPVNNTDEIEEEEEEEENEGFFGFLKRKKKKNEEEFEDDDM